MKKLLFISIFVFSFLTAKSTTVSVTPTAPTLSLINSQDTLILTETGTGTWTATSQQSWLTIISGTGSANGKIIYTVTFNSSVALLLRVDTIVISGTGITTLKVVIKQNTSFISKKLRGTYAELVSDTSFHIKTEEAILSMKTYPTNFYWVQIDSTVQMNISQLDQQGLVSFTITFHLYWDYYSYWSWLNPFRLKTNPVLLDGSIDICAGDGYDLCSNFDTDLKNGLATFFNISPTKVIIYSY